MFEEVNMEKEDKSNIEEKSTKDEPSNDIQSESNEEN